MKNIKRDLHFVSPTIKTKIIKKIVTYWILCLTFSMLPMIIGTTMADPNRFFLDHMGDLALRYWPMYVMILGLLPFAIRDALQLTNRALGPLERLKSELAEFRKSGKYKPVNSREDDFLNELIKEINDAILSNVTSENAGKKRTQDELVESVV